MRKVMWFSSQQLFVGGGGGEALRDDTQNGFEADYGV